MKLFLLTPVAVITFAACSPATTTAPPDTPTSIISNTPSITTEIPDEELIPDGELPTDNVAKLADVWNTDYNHQERVAICIDYNSNPSGMWETFSTAPWIPDVTHKEFTLFFDAICSDPTNFNDPDF